MDVFYTDSSPQLKAYAKADVDKRISELEKQLAEARAENAALVAEFQRLADEPPTLEEIAADLDKIEMLGKELAEAQTEVEQMALEIENQQYTITCASEENQQLKESLAEARAEIERLNKDRRLAIAINSAMQESSYDMPDMRGHECSAKHKMLSLFDLWRKKVRPRLPGFVDDEISRRDKLIEQMREALNILVASATPSGPLWHGSAEMKIARAALSAAERMKKK
jgi:chromosome segregation ATPase